MWRPKPTRAMKICKEIDDYIAMVRSGEYPYCQEQYLLCNLVENVFQEEDIRVDEDQLKRYLSKQSLFPFKLFPWEKFIFTLHNCVYRSDGLLRWPTLFALLGRGAGKNGYVSFEAFSWITPINGVKDYDVDIFATSEDQARTSFDDDYNVLEDHKVRMEKFFKWNTEVIQNLATRSKLKYRTSGVKTKDGGRPGAVIFDEYHAYENYKLIDVAKTGLGKKPFPRQTIITTNGYVRGGPLDDMKVHVDDILRRGMPDNGMLPFVCKLDDPKEVDIPRMWHKANPSLRYFPTLQQELDLEYADYKRNPSGNSSFMVKRMNIPQTFDDESVTDWENIKACARPLPDLEWTDCIAGIDYTKTTDFLSAGLLFRRDGVFYWKQHSWVCRASLDLPKIKAPLETWAEKGFLAFCDGPEIPPDVPAAWLEEQAREYNVTILGLDNFRITLLAEALKRHGFDTDKGGANNIMLTKRVTVNRYVPVITSLFNNHLIAWGDDPMMPWYTWNASVETDKGNQYYGKKDAERRKTDGFMALVSAICASADLSDSGDSAGDQEIEIMTF